MPESYQRLQLTQFWLHISRENGRFILYLKFQSSKFSNKILQISIRCRDVVAPSFFIGWYISIRHTIVDIMCNFSWKIALVHRILGRRVPACNWQSRIWHYVVQWDTRIFGIKWIIVTSGNISEEIIYSDCRSV